VGDWTGTVGARAKAAAGEMKYLLSMASTRREQAAMVGFIIKLYVARAMPFDTYRWKTTVRVGGVRYNVGLRTSEIYVLDEVYGQRMYNRVPGYAPSPGWAVIDLGANIGVFTLHAALAGAFVYAFEPNPDCFARLRSNVRDNGVTPSVMLFEQAVSDRRGAGRMEVTKGGTTGGTVARTAAADDSGPVRMTTLDEAMAQSSVRTIDLLKMDIEGAEAAALKGASNVLGRTQRIIAEYHSQALLAECTQILEGHGFVREHCFVYYDAIGSSDGEEVGMFYARRVPVLG
jgi:FkbM family methyltransferase